MTAHNLALTPRLLVKVARLAAAACALGMTILLLGPFQGLEQVFGLGDTAAHAIAFFCITNGLFLIAPIWRRGDLAMLAMGAAVVSELAQSLTGRSMSIGDAGADAVGVLVALVPGQIERLRWMMRRHPDTALSEIAANDRRHRPSMASASRGRKVRQTA